jgi:ssDNA-specific exonuclease RecJ
VNYLELKFSEEELTAIHDLAGNNYSPEKIALYLDVDKKAFLQTWQNKDSLVRQHYDRGQLVAEFNINNKQKELAEKGNITAAQIFLKESERNEVNNIRNRILFGDDY